MFFEVITLFPEMFEAITAYGISGRAAKREIVQVTCINPRDFAEGNYKRVDERPFGGGPGMVMMAKPLEDTLDAVAADQTQATGKKAPVILLSPQGERFSQKKAKYISDLGAATLLCGR